MKKRVLLTAVVMGMAIVLLVSRGYAANDPSHDPKIVEMIENQQMRIDQGVKKGQLTKDEAALVQGNLDRIKADEAQLKAAGKLTEKEKTRIIKKLDQNSKMIHQERGNVIRQID